MVRGVQNKDKKPFTCDVLLELGEWPINKTNKVALRVVKWSSAKEPALELRRMYFDKRVEEWRPQRACGLTARELQVIQQRHDEVLKALQQGTNNEDDVESDSDIVQTT